ncbi:hypothetical protein [Bradyrhizobium sp. th.b2]|uniref:hypothetical protein n=1 Tax=Bradyrhizobium sp. th-b2 TaxID=172088 RepID=UPI0004024666|nr:hypothetical protein [Bradyrhizobium sp. th.b2]
MSIADLRSRMADVPGIETLTLALSAGYQHLTWANGGMSASVGAFASDQDIEDAIRNAMRLPAVSIIPDQPKEETMSVTGAGYAGGSFSTRLRAIRQKVENTSTKMDAALTRMEQAADAHDQLATAVEGDADRLLADIGQFTNGGQ